MRYFWSKELATILLTITVAFYVLYNKITHWSEGPWLKLKHRLISRGNNLLSDRNIFFW